MDLTGPIKSLYDLLRDFVEGREARTRRHRKLLILRTMRESQQGQPATLYFSEARLSDLTGIPPEELHDPLYELEREGMIVRVVDGYLLKERWGIGGPYRLT